MSRSEPGVSFKGSFDSARGDAAHAPVLQGLSKDLELGLLRRVTVVIKAMDGLPLERFIIDFGFMQMDALDGGNRDAKWVELAQRASPCDLEGHAA
ncbi:hypothetical protein A1Q1_02479 [Trichosporon asahii var. asahii CBS 2479]|uniref:Uncharacterized protein n=1 Tax=Trichosporon asahii var. asahii (strain ATCC 90039 / CBS 2479 / JCM 2466 / KCTC 7840 / NBRC 103889/ NCYC 2677 / UAMH 7654) TaxID=1186058 RepID=J5QPR0_TRIAS|nr:hypothetical protein A1Q1_02479 [Trichosporon asahii var. asahii CBS 2479]EJT48458.1 hypothetical protein A1Q1_02479 [Trichosporon asahii var. asahii CBS 2479]